MKTHKDLDVWKLSIDLVEIIYRETRSFPREELYGITSQMRRAAFAIPSNIAEGFARFSEKETLHFLYISLGSLSELDTQIIISKRLEFNISNGTSSRLEILRMKLLNLIKYQKSKIPKRKNKGSENTDQE